MRLRSRPGAAELSFLSRSFLPSLSCSAELSPKGYPYCHHRHPGFPCHPVPGCVPDSHGILPQNPAPRHHTSPPRHPRRDNLFLCPLSGLPHHPPRKDPLRNHPLPSHLHTHRTHNRLPGCPLHRLPLQNIPRNPLRSHLHPSLLPQDTRQNTPRPGHPPHSLQLRNIPLRKDLPTRHHLPDNHQTGPGLNRHLCGAHQRVSPYFHVVLPLPSLLCVLLSAPPAGSLPRSHRSSAGYPAEVSVLFSSFLP